jgi:hypothetical protein
MRDVIAVLDGLNPSPSAGGNYSGGSSWAGGFPTYPSSEGLAGGAGLSEYLGILAGGEGSGFVAERTNLNPSASKGGNYGGGSSWAAGFPTYQSSEGLASIGYDVTRERRNPSASEGANYSGGSSWAPGFPTYPSSEGLAGLDKSIAIRGALHGLISGGMGETAAVVAVRRAWSSGAFTATGCRAAYQAAVAAATMAGYDRQFAAAAGDRAAQRCVAESWASYGTKS